MKNNNDNLTTIFHAKHDQIKLLVGSPAKAEFLSKLIFWWQISDYTIEGSPYTWLSYTIDTMHEKSGISKTSIGRYLTHFSALGLIEKRKKKRYCKKKRQEIACLWIRLTDKLLAVLKGDTKSPESTATIRDTNSDSNKQENYIDINKKHKEGRAEQTECFDLDHIDDTGSTKMTKSFFNIDNNQKNNTISNFDNVNSVKNKSFTLATYSIDSEIGERVTEEVTTKVKGMICNLKKQHGLIISDEEKLFAEVIFSITNPEQFKHITCMTHKLNTISKLLREKKWSEPRGFESYWDIGQKFKERRELREKKLFEEKLANALAGTECPQKQAEIKARLETTLAEEYRYIKPKTDSKMKPTKESTIFEQGSHSPEEPVKKPSKEQDTLAVIEHDIKIKEDALYSAEDQLQDAIAPLKKRLEETISSLTTTIAKLYERRAMMMLGESQQEAA